METKRTISCRSRCARRGPAYPRNTFNRCLARWNADPRIGGGCALFVAAVVAVVDRGRRDVAWGCAAAGVDAERGWVLSWTRGGARRLMMGAGKSAASRASAGEREREEGKACEDRCICLRALGVCRSQLPSLSSEIRLRVADSRRYTSIPYWNRPEKAS